MHPLTSPRRNDRPRAPAVFAFIAVLAVLPLTSCGGDDSVGPPEPDAPATVEIVSGSGQTATTGTAVANSLLVRVVGRSGAPVAGVSVAFVVTVGGGSVQGSNGTTVTTGADGTASPGPWTLGAPGPQELEAAVFTLPPVVFTATSLGIPAEIAVAAGADQEVAAGSRVPVPPEVLVTDADGAPLAGITVTFGADRGAAITGATPVTDRTGRAAVGSWTLGTATGIYTLAATVAGAEVKGNPARVEARALPGPAAAVEAVEGDGQESETRLPVPVPPKVQVQDAHGNGVAGATVTFTASGGSAAVPGSAVTDPDGFATVDKWILGPTAGATYRLTATARDGDSAVDSVTFRATGVAAVYRIDIVHANPGSLSESQRGAFDKAEQFWEKAITGNLPWSTVLKQALEDCLARNGFTLDVPGDRVVDDLLIYVDIRDIDGPGGVFGGAGPCQIRADTGLPVVGTMFFDVTDMNGLSEEARDETILHEMAHVIGFGTLWEYLGLLREPKSRGGTDPHFIGPAALDAFSSIGGDAYTDSKPVPVQSVGGPGVWDGHWREFVFHTELMTSFIDRGKNPLSVVTLASFQDLGYEGVDLGLADEFTLPSGAMAPEIVGAGRGIDLGDHISRAPIAVVDRDGRVVRYVTPSRR